MEFILGDVLCLRTTGERVCVIDTDTSDEKTEVRRAVIGEGGAISHSPEWFFDFELESVEDHANRQVSEMILKSKAQVKLMKVETKLQKELEEDAVLSDSETKPTLSVVPKLN